MDISKLKSNSFDVSQLVQAAEKANNSGSVKRDSDDERLWKPTRDKAGNAYAVLRFLPPSNEDAPTPWAQYWSHGFNVDGRWLIDNCPSSIGKDCPVCEKNQKLWNEGHREIVSGSAGNQGSKRNLHYVANIYVVADPSAPQNEGKVFLYKFGKKIFDKIMDAMQPSFPDEKPINPFDIFEGADFALKVSGLKRNTNYDKSEFRSSAAFLEGDMEAIEQVPTPYSLAEFTDPANYKEYEQLASRLATVFSTSSASTKQAAADLITNEAPTMESAPEIAAPEPAVSAEPPALNEEQPDEEDTLAYFQQLANQE